MCSQSFQKERLHISIFLFYIFYIFFYFYLIYHNFFNDKICPLLSKFCSVTLKPVLAYSDRMKGVYVSVIESVTLII